MFTKLTALSYCLLLSTSLLAQSPAPIQLNPVAAQPNPAKLHPVERLPRERFGRVGSFPLGFEDLRALLFPSASHKEKAAVIEGLQFFTTPHVEAEGLGPMANQRFCLGCHLSTADAVRRNKSGSQLVRVPSHVARAARSTPTNFDFTAFDAATGGGRAPDNVDATNNTGKTDAFTLFGDFNPTTQLFHALATVSTGGVQRVRPALDACVPDAIPPMQTDPLLSAGFRRTTGERAAPPYIARGLMEAIYDDEILSLEQAEILPIQTSLVADFPECVGDCVAGRHNATKPSAAFACPADPNVSCGTNFTDVLVGRLGLRAAGPTLTQFMVGGSNGELGFTSPLMPHEPFSLVNANRPGCVNSLAAPELPLSTILSLRTLMRLTAPPDFGVALKRVLYSRNPNARWPKHTKEAKVQRGAELFGVDLIAFANRMIPGRMPEAGDGRDEHAIKQADRKLNCAGCHSPVMTTGQLPAEVGAKHLNNAWVPLFSDLLIHEGPNIDAERNAPTVRLPLSIQRVDSNNRLFNTYDIARGTADDTLPGQGVANGREWRTPPLMGIGKIGPPFLHDGRVYLSKESVHSTPASTVYSDRQGTNEPLVVRSLDEAIRAAIELHDLPAPFDDPKQSTSVGGGCPVPPGNTIGDVTYANGAADICPPYSSATSSQNRGAARKVIKRWHDLSAEDQEAVVEFLKQL